MTAEILTKRFYWNRGTVPRITDNDFGEITASINGEAIRSWEYRSSAEHARKMPMAHEFAEGWFQAERKLADRVKELEGVLKEARSAVANADIEKFGIGGGDGETHWYLGHELLRRIDAALKKGEENE
jgi:hypothetical protein